MIGAEITTWNGDIPILHTPIEREVALLPLNHIRMIASRFIATERFSISDYNQH